MRCAGAEWYETAKIHQQTVLKELRIAFDARLGLRRRLWLSIPDLSAAVGQWGVLAGDVGGPAAGGLAGSAAGPVGTVAGLVVGSGVAYLGHGRLRKFSRNAGYASGKVCQRLCASVFRRSLD